MKPEIILLLDMGVKPKDIGRVVGCTVATVYYYNKQYKVAKAKMPELLKKLGGN